MNNPILAKTTEWASHASIDSTNYSHHEEGTATPEETIIMPK